MIIGTSVDAYDTLIAPGVSILRILTDPQSRIAIMNDALFKSFPL